MEIRFITPTLLKNMKLIRNSEKAVVYKGIGEEAGNIFKFFKMHEGDSKKNKRNLELKILNAKPIHSVPEIVIPTYALYSEKPNKIFAGYQMKEIKGPQFREYIVDKNEELDLYKFADEFSNLENIVSRGNKKGFVFPDIATLSNIMVLTNHTSSFKKSRKFLIDYEGIQVGKFYTSGISEGINPYLLHLEKYYKDKKRNLYSKNLDYASILHMYFRIVLHVDLNYIGRKSKITGKLYTIDDIFLAINLLNYDVMQKVWNLFVPNIDNEKVGDLFYEIAEKYKLESIKEKNREFRYLVKK